MAVTVKCTGYFVSADGHAYLNWDDGNQSEFGSAEDMELLVNSVDEPSQGDFARKLLMRWWLVRDPDRTNSSLIVGKTMVFDMETAQMIEVTTG